MHAQSFLHRFPPVVLAIVVSLAVGAPCALHAQRNDEAATAAHFDSIRTDTARLIEFLRAMPKGGDLHNHLSGAVHAESWAEWAAADGLCFVTTSSAIARPPCDGVDRVPASRLLSDSSLLAQAVDAWSMRGWHAGAESGADHFFATFEKTAAVGNAHLGEMLAQVMSTAAAEHVSYLELMVNADDGVAPRMGLRAGWNSDFQTERARLDRDALRDSLRRITRNLDVAEAREREILHCGTPQADAGCAVTVRYIYQVIRSRRPEQVFAQILAGFEMPAIDHRYVSFNLVAPEHGSVALGDFDLHMRMIEWLRPSFGNVPLTLHAGELSSSVAATAAMRSHIRESVELGHAARIGHGVDVRQEDDPDSLLREMSAKHVLVEIALTSNDVILGVRGSAHPLSTYLSHGVPVTLVSDDPGVSLSDMTHEYLRAVLDQHVDYRTLKAMAKNSIAYSFVDDGAKAGLRADLDRALVQFESKR